MPEAYFIQSRIMKLSELYTGGWDELLRVLHQGALQLRIENLLSWQSKGGRYLTMRAYSSLEMSLVCSSLQ